MEKAKQVFLSILMAAVVVALTTLTVKAMRNLLGGVAAIGISRAIVPSPNNEWLAVRMEHWKKDERVRTLSVKNLHNGIFYSLTPEYLEIVQGPDPSVIAYISRDSSNNWYTVGVYAPDKTIVEEEPIPHPYPVARSNTGILKKDLAFSSDGQHLRFAIRLNFESLGRISYDYRTLDGRAYLTDEPLKGVEWLPPQKPAKLPDFMTERTPQIHEETIPVWSPDSDALYVHDEEGIWRVNLLMPRMQVWELFLPMQGVRAFRLSADGQHLLANLDGGDSDPSVVLVDLKSEERVPKRLGQGWGAAFSPDGKRFAYAHSGGLYVGSVEKGAARRIEASEQRNFGRNAAPIWTSDGAAVYIQSDEGVWRVDAESAENAEWKLALPMEEIGFFDLSADGRWLLAESGDGVNIDRVFKNSLRKGIQHYIDRLGKESQKYERNLILIDLHAAEPAPKHVGYGWMPVIVGDRYFFGTYLDMYMDSLTDDWNVPRILSGAGASWMEYGFDP